MPSGYKNKKKSGFSIIELLVVIAIIGLLSTLAVMALSSARLNSKIAKAKADIEAIYNAIGLLENDTGEWPNHQTAGIMCLNIPGGCPSNNELCETCACKIGDSCAGLTANDGNFNNWNGPYMSNIPLDPWGHQYFFDTDYNHSSYSNSVMIGSYGPNGVGNNVYDTDDIVKKID